MKRKFTLLLSAFLIAGMIYDYDNNMAHTFSGGAPSGRTGSPGDGASCAISGCHVGGPAQTDEVITVSTTVPGSGYVGGTTYDITVTMTKSGGMKFGFQLSPQDIAGAAVGTLIAGVETAITGGHYMTHMFGTTGVTGGTRFWNFQWEAPPGGSGDATLYYAGNFTNNQFNSSGDVIVTSSLVISEYVVISWDGSASTDWDVASNWSSNSVPTATDNVTIPSAPSNQPQVTSESGTPAACADLTVESGATLTVNAGKAITVSGATNNNGTLLIEADATGIGSFLDNGTITGAGNFQMEQYLTGSGTTTPDGLFWYVSSPTANATSNVYSAAGTDRLWSASEATQAYPEITDNSTNLMVSEGYIARIGANATNTFTGGTFNTGNESATGLSRTGTSETNRGYNLVGNPYPSTLNWFTASRTNLETTIWYRTHNGSTMLFDTYNATNNLGTNNNGGGAVTRFIPPTQAFWVRVPTDGQTGQVDFDNTDRSHGSATSIYKIAAEEGTIRLKISNGTVSDEQIIAFNSSALDSYDNHDSQKFFVDNVPQLYSNLASDTLTINGLNNPVSTPSVDLGVKIPTQGDYTFNAGTITLTETPVLLEDRHLSVFQDLNTNPVYAFTSEAGNIGDRFVLHFSSITGITNIESTIEIFSVYDLVYVNLSNPNNGLITIFDMSGRTVHTQPISSERTTINLSSSAGIYLVKVETAKQSIVKKVIIQ